MINLNNIEKIIEGYEKKITEQFKGLAPEVRAIYVHALSILEGDMDKLIECEKIAGKLSGYVSPKATARYTLAIADEMRNQLYIDDNIKAF